jgi:hypothetical protein
MQKLCCVAFLAGLALTAAGRARAEEKEDCKTVLDKAIKALGGEKNLAKVKAATWKTKGKFYIMDNENEFISESAYQAPNRYRGQFEGEFMGNKIKAVTVVDGDKGWRHFMDETNELDKDGLANEKRNISFQWVPTAILPLRDKAYKLEAIDAEKVDGKAAAGIKVTAKDGKSFKLYFNKESGLPVKLAAKTVGFGGDEFDLEVFFSDYKEVQGIKKAMKIVQKRNGDKMMEQTITEFKIKDKLDDKLFAKP